MDCALCEIAGLIIETLYSMGWPVRIATVYASTVVERLAEEKPS